MTNQEYVQQFILETPSLRDADDLNVTLSQDQTHYGINIETLLHEFSELIRPKTQSIELAVENSISTINVPDPFYVFMKFDHDSPLGVMTGQGESVSFVLNRPEDLSNKEGSIQFAQQTNSFTFQKDEKTFSIYAKSSTDLTDEEKSLINL